MARNLYLGFGSGLLAGVLGTIGMTGGRAVPRAMAQVPELPTGLREVGAPARVPEIPPPIVKVAPPPAPAQPGAPPDRSPFDPESPAPGDVPAPVLLPSHRFQISTWAYPGTSGMSPPSYGAYLVDTQTGKVWASKDGGRMKPVPKSE
jgi:hypothetical protein